MTNDKSDMQVNKDDVEVHISLLEKGPPKGFGKGVNDYLNHYVTVSDAKAVAFLALNFVVIQFLLKDHFYYTWGFPFHFIALIFLSLSILAATFVLFPRLPRGSKGLIFWQDIIERKTPEMYENELAGIQKDGVERQYAHQNFYVSKVLHKKMRFAQSTIIFFLVGITFAIACVVGHCHY